MGSFRVKTIASGLLMTLGMAGAAQAASLNIGVAANFKNALTDIIAAFTSDPTKGHLGDTITFVSDSTGNLKTSILNGNPNGYDLFLAADNTTPKAVQTANAALVIGNQFNYTIGKVVLWSNSPGVDVSKPLASNYFTTAGMPWGQVIIANHSTAPYGAAAAAILTAKPYYLTLPAAGGSNAYIVEKSNIDNAYQAVLTQQYKVGFVAKSQVCSKATGTEVFSGTSHTVYAKNIVQAGIKLAQTGRAKDETTLLNDFVTYLKDPAGTAAVIMDKYCYLHP
jgi:molybdate transport system substrate-binding protein